MQSQNILLVSHSISSNAASETEQNAFLRPSAVTVRERSRIGARGAVLVTYGTPILNLHK